jgi:rhomboid family GlyGly-CTERM serine protease
MNTSVAQTIRQQHPSPWRPRLDTVAFGVLLACFNWPVFLGEVPWSWVFLPESVAAGEWWRVLTHPLAHVTWYHLLLDASAFLLLYDGLRQGRMLGRLAYVVAAAAGGLLASWLASPAFQEVGFCGLSGVAHGLMAVAALELADGTGKSRAQRKAGALAVGLVGLKAGWEAASGEALFQWLHFGLMGTPLAVSHAGGVVGGMLAFLLLSLRPAVDPGEHLGMPLEPVGG